MPRWTKFEEDFRPHARGVDSNFYVNFNRRFSQTPRAWGGLTRKTQQRKRLVSDPTRVGWTGNARTPVLPLDFRPHARGVDLYRGLALGIVRGFQTPRAWGGRSGHALQSQGCVSDPTRVGWTSAPQLRKTSSSTFRPHARGVDKEVTTAIDVWHISDPTRVGWTACVTVSSGIQYFRPHARGVDTRRRFTTARSPFQTPRTWGGRESGVRCH